MKVSAMLIPHHRGGSYQYEAGKSKSISFACVTQISTLQSLGSVAVNPQSRP